MFRSTDGWHSLFATPRTNNTYRRLNLDFVLAFSVIVIERLIHDENPLDWIGQYERVVLVAALIRRERAVERMISFAGRLC